MKCLKGLMLSFLCSPALMCNAHVASENFPGNVVKHVLSNGFTVLVRHTDTLQNVAIELWYGVGAKHEGSGEKGDAHLIEHMLFKGTQKMSETDIDEIGSKFSAYWNAATSHDYTHMVFRFPRDDWHVALPILADCMTNCTFKSELLNSELKVVVQELKMYKDNHTRTLFSEMMSSIFPDHPYHNPVIGYKQDLFDASSERLKKFYKKHYVPNNAVLVVVGDVKVEDVIKQAEEHFGKILEDFYYEQPKNYYNRDLRSQSVTLYRDIQKPHVQIAFVIPGIKDTNYTYAAEILLGVLANGQASRLHKTLVDKEQLLDGIGAQVIEMFDHSLLMFFMDPRSEECIEPAIVHIQNELASIAQNGCSASELDDVAKTYQRNFYAMLEQNSRQASLIGELYLATQNHNALFSGIITDTSKLQELIKDFVKLYLRSTVMHRGKILPLPHDEKEFWIELQQESDNADAKILHGRVRDTDVEEAKYAVNLEASAPRIHAFPAPEMFRLSNGIEIFAYNTSHVPLINFSINFAASEWHEPIDKRGCFEALMSMLNEGGTSVRSADEMKSELRKFGVHYSMSSFELSATFMSEDFVPACELISEMLLSPAFDIQALSKIKEWMKSEYLEAQDNEKQIAAELFKATIFKNNPKSQSRISAPNEIEAISLTALQEIYKDVFVPSGTRIFIVGDLSSCPNYRDNLEQFFGTWNNDNSIPLTNPMSYQERTNLVTRTHHINRDQVIIKIGGLSINLLDCDYEAILLYQANLNQRLFRLREETGAFYTIHGSLFSFLDKYSSAWSIGTIISRDRVDEVVELLHNFIQHDYQNFNEDDVAAARAKIIKSREELYGTNASILSTIKGLQYYGLGFDYYQKQAERLFSITAEDVQKAVAKILHEGNRSTILVGRLGQEDQCEES